MPRSPDYSPFCPDCIQEYCECSVVVRCIQCDLILTGEEEDLRLSDIGPFCSGRCIRKFYPQMKKPCTHCVKKRLDELDAEWSQEGPTNHKNWIARHLKYTDLMKQPCSHNLNEVLKPE